MHGYRRFRVSKQHVADVRHHGRRAFWAMVCEGVGGGKKHAAEAAASQPVRLS